MIVQDLSPYIFEFGPFHPKYYGMSYVIGFLVTYIFLEWVARRGFVDGFESDDAKGLILYIILGAIAGGRLFAFILFYPWDLFLNPLEIFYIWHGGMTFYGALIGISAMTAVYARRHGLRPYRLLDTITIPASAALIFVKIGNFMNSELVGTVTDVPWCIVFKRYDDGCRHPAQVYNMIQGAAMLAIMWLARFRMRLKEGIQFWGFCWLYGIMRFILDFWKEDARLFGISQGQALAALLVIISTYFIWRIAVSGDQKGWFVPGPRKGKQDAGKRG